jgi:hypothetical protein
MFRDTGDCLETTSNSAVIKQARRTRIYLQFSIAVPLSSSTNPSALSFAMLNPLTTPSQNAENPIPSIASTITAIRTIDNKLMSMHHRLYHDFPCALV